MALFLSTYMNKVDRKGRVSVPASFRAALAGQAFHGVIAFPSVSAPSIDCFGMDRMERLSASVDEIDLFSDQQRNLAATIFADAHQLAFDGEGRIVLPEILVAHTKIAEQALFAGIGPSFQIWNPDNFRRHQQTARSNAQSQGLSLKLRPAPGSGT